MRALKIKEKSLGEHRSTAITLAELASLYKLKGEYAKAEPLYLRALMIAEKSFDKNHPSLASLLSNIAELYKNQGKNVKAASFLLRALKIVQNVSFLNINSLTLLNNAAELYREEGLYEEAEKLYLQLLEFQEKLLGESHPDLAISLNNFALLYQSQKMYAKAEPLYKRALKIIKDKVGDNHPRTAVFTNNLALLYQSQELYEKAELLYLQALSVNENILGDIHPHTTMVIHNLAWMYGLNGQLSKSKLFWQKHLHKTNRFLYKVLAGSGDATRQSFLQKENLFRNAYLSFYRFANLPEDALHFSLSRKALLLRLNAEAKILFKNSVNPKVKQQADELVQLRVQLSNFMFSNNAKKEQTQLLEDKINTLEMQLVQQIPAFKRSTQKITPEQLQQRLDDKSVLIDFLAFTEKDLKTGDNKTKQLIALVINNENVKLISLGELQPIATAIKTYQTAIENTNSREQTLKQAAQTLYQKLWKPLSPYLENKTSAYLIPDGILHLLPFKALQDENGNYLAEKIHLITLSSARDIVLPPLEGKANQAAIFAPHVYGGENKNVDLICKNQNRGISLKKMYFCPLPKTLVEAQAIDKIFSKKSPAKLFKQKEATEQAISSIKSPKILHLATHGFYLDDYQFDSKTLENTHGLMQSLDQTAPQIMIDNPLTRSGLAFANANLGVKGIQTDNTDGILTALEVLNLDLAGTELVTLSACDTSKGSIKIGEGVYSLNRAFQEAGAKAVLSTLWKVNDAATAEFMQKFYNRFLNDIPAQQAIQETQEEFMQHEEYSDPYYWAGFVMTGKE